MTTEPPALDIDRILACLSRHNVEFLLVGGVAAIAYGARRPTADLDCLARRTLDNLERLAAALRELNARLRVEGLTDDEASRLPTVLDSQTLARMEISTWRTDAGDFDVLTDLPARDGRRLRYRDLIGRAELQDVSGITVRVAALEDVIASKEWADRPKDREALDELRDLALRREAD
jgi:predicted nucleotidyltransferase